jgi:hypothetical protein
MAGRKNKAAVRDAASAVHFAVPAPLAAFEVDLIQVENARIGACFFCTFKHPSDEDVGISSPTRASRKSGYLRSHSSHHPIKRSPV